MTNHFAKIESKVVATRYWPACLLAMVAMVAITAARADDDVPLSADRLYLMGRYDEAVTAYEKLAAEDPVKINIAATLGLARCRAATGKADQAIKLLTEALAKTDVVRQPKSANLRAELAKLAFERGDYETARKLVDESLKLDPAQTAARWLDAELLRVSGRLKEAENAYEWFIDFYNRGKNLTAEQLHDVGRAAAEYARWRRNSGQFNFLVNTLYPDVLKLNAHYWPAKLESALLFLEKYNESDAAKDLTAALAINPNSAPVHAARARLAVEQFDLPAARQSVQRALAINPRLVAAHQVQADVQLADLRPDEAIQTLEAARKLNPADEETLGRLAAAVGAVEGFSKDGQPGPRMQAILDEAVQRNEHCGPFFAALGGSFDRLRRYPFAARYFEAAQARMPQLIGVRGQLGLTLMRLGDEAKAAQMLNESFKMDPFNVRVKNMLAVLDVLQGYAVLETEHFVIKFDRGHDELLAQYAARYLEEEVYPAIVQKLGYAPREKSLFEIFNRAKNTGGHGWFSARMVGLPFVHTVGACAGQMVALVSPNATPKKFNWARVLKHEFVHVVNLQQTNFNIPHWYTEALAVRSEERPRPPAWTQLLARRAAEGQLFHLDTINTGFIRPRNADDWTLAYCQAELYAEYLAEAYGPESLAKLIAAYADNLTTRDALRRCFSVEQPEFEKGYRAHLDKVIAGVAANKGGGAVRSFAELQRAAEAEPENADLLAELAHAQLLRNANAEARESALAARKLQERHALAGYVLARLQLSIGDTNQAVALLEETFDPESPRQDHLALLVGIRLKANDFADAERLCEIGLKKLSGGDRTKWLQTLSKVHLKSGDDKKLKGTLAELAAFEYDNVVLCKKLAELSLAEKDYAGAARWAQEALYIDVQDADTHGVLAEALVQLGEPKQLATAIREFEVAIRLDPKRPEWRFALANAHVDAKQPDQARKTLEELLELDPQYPGADVLLESLKK